jgi:L-ascorbate metabolism protein UlaG (beta-lactamase superfamily)
LVSVFSFTFFGYGAILLQLEKHLLFNPGILEDKPLVDVSKITPSYVLVSHTASELFGNAQEFPHKQGSIVIGPTQMSEQMRKASVPGYMFEELEDNQTKDLGGTVKVTGHILKQGGFLAPRSLAFAVKSPQGCLLYLGKGKDASSLTNAEPDLLCVPVGGKPHGTIDPKEAVSVTHRIRPRYAFPICGHEEQRKKYIELLTTQNSGIIPIDLSVGETFTLL